MKAHTARSRDAKSIEPTGPKFAIVADLGRCKVYRFEDRPEFSQPQLTLVAERETEVTHHLSEDLTDQFGRFGKVPASTGERSDYEEHNLDLERRHRAVRALGRWLSQLIELEQPAACYFAADNRINQGLLEAMDPASRAKIQVNIPANLTKVNADDLIKQFRSAAEPGRTA